MFSESLHPALTAIPIGIAFGFVLESSGLGNPNVIARQFVGRDFTVLRVMFGAIVTGMLGLAWGSRAGWFDLATTAMPPTDLSAQAIGAVIFGGGFALAALCPGTACVAASSGRRDGVATMGGMFAGTALTPVIWPALGGVADDLPREGATLAADLGISASTIVLLITVTAVVALSIGRRIEAREGGGPAWLPSRMEAVALSLAVAYAVTGGSNRGATSDLRSIAGEIVEERDHVDALDLATWIREGQSGLRVVDVREDLDTASYIIPGAALVGLRDLDTLTLGRDEQLVLYSDGGAHAAQAWVLLRARGLDNVLVLKDGMAAWEDEVLSPRPPSTPDDTSKARFERARGLSLWFGGIPARVRQFEAAAPAERPRRRRTC